jgi:hypothetical protein
MGIGILIIFMLSLFYKGRIRIKEVLIKCANKITKKKSSDIL